MKILLTLPLIAPFSNAAKLNGFLRKQDIPSSGKSWVSLDNGVEFQPSAENDPSVEHVRKLWGFGSREKAMFADGSETYYDDYAQAWRLLGFYVDCDICADESGSSPAACVQDGQQTMCQRFLLWAAYVDLDYSGNGEGEYMYYDRNEKSWNRSACKDSGSDRCARMDCHESNSHFKLLGVFKEPDYGTFLEQLYKQQGDCVWTDEEYKSMQSSRQTWPQGCTQSSSSGIYYDIKPEAGGSMDVGLYSDYQCSTEYEGEMTAEQVLSSNGYQGNLEEDIAAWNNAFDAFKICQPCKTSSLVSLLNKNEEVNVDGSRYQHRNDDGGDDDGFTCESSSVNQCAMFQSTTTMLTASYRDIVLAEEQGTVGSIKINGSELGNLDSWQRPFLSALSMMASFCILLCAFLRCRDSREENDLKRPLMDRRNGRSNRTRGSNGRSRN